ncbi:hypothetical protein ZEAMMB73_Zm00001d037393 [Zea mays]|uniref:Uncharacterized protein n=1 Tax=Zea mays TaxID=4577 RepID=A0A096TR91_MAIZE|nr:hypothetical protein ZEAMMB73_Zm00001d037393 [Zea mays]
MAAVVLTDGSAIRKSASMGTSPSSSRGPPATARPQLLGPTSPTAVWGHDFERHRPPRAMSVKRGRVRAASASAGTRRTRSASAAAAVASTSRRAPAPPAITLPPASASKDKPPRR